MGSFLNPAMNEAAGGMRTGLVGAVVRRLRGLSAAKAGSESALRVEARLSLGPKKQLMLVNCCGKKVLLAVSGDSIAPVMEVEGPGKKAGRGETGRAGPGGTGLGGNGTGRGKKGVRP